MNELYGDFNLQFLAGNWREGSSDKVNTVINPNSAETLVSIRCALLPT